MNQLYRQHVLAACVLFLLFGATFFFASSLPFSDSRKSHFNEQDVASAGLTAREHRLHKAGSIGSKDNPFAREQHEIDRLKDPATGRIPANMRELELAYSKRMPTIEAVERSTNPYAKLATFEWSARGPFNVGGRTRALAMHVTNESLFLAGGVSGGMWRSANGGSSWTKVTRADQLHSVTTVAQDKRAGKQNTWYYGTGEIIGNSANKTGAPYLGSGVFKSIDNGITWNQLPATQVPIKANGISSVWQFVHRVATNPANLAQDEVFAATVSGIQRSTNGGESWFPVLGSDDLTNYSTNPYYTDITIGNTGVMYAGLSQTGGGGNSSTKGIFRSVNGVNWANITPAGFPATYGRIVMDIAPSNENIVYFLVYTTTNLNNRGNLWKYQYVSGDGTGSGGIWTDLSTNLPMLGGTSGNLDLQTGYNMVVKVRPDNPNFVILGGTNLYKSTNGFSSTSTTRKIGGYTINNNSYALYPNHHPDNHEVVFYRSNPSVMLSAHDGGVSRTADNTESVVEWESLNRGYRTTQFYTVAIDLNTTDDFVVGGMQDNGSWAVGNINEQTGWVEQLGGDGAFAAVTTHSVFVSTQNGTLYRYAYNDAGQRTGYARIDPPKTTGYLFVNPYTIDPNNEYRMYLPAGDTLWRNNNLAQIPVSNTGNQSTLGWEVAANLATNEAITAVSVSKSPANVVYFGTRTGKLYKFQDGTVPAPMRLDVTGSNFPAGAYINCIAIDPRDANKAVVVFTNYRVQSLFYTVDGGASWSPVSGNLEENGNVNGNGPSTRWVSILPGADGSTKYFVGTSTGLYATSALNGTATTWLRDGHSTIGEVPVDMVISRTTDNLVLVGTHGNGVYSRRYNGPLLSKEEVNAAKLGLGQNYPNPFRYGAVTTVPFTLEKPANVKLVVYDLTGKAVATLTNGKRLAGQHQVQWNGRSASGQELPSGTYLYQLTIDGQHSTKRMVYTR
ncbi:FlgD immunoglobulin-like domain containing protein [Rufibacter sp. LB8]|uniref:FlgD immunoglobulin-like domain containing protein n=1 Tax=Rufibacter sp. LB8 TaxID=2777781 RepID=UPI00178C7282|nr:FlgD immunoglobulin-like domain containing protein [Rufibacter sp. LB8]